MLNELQEQFQLALESLDRALVLRPQTLIALRHKASVLRELDRWNESAHCLKTLHEHGGGDDFTVLANALVPILKSLQGSPRPTQTSLSWSIVPTVAVSMRDAYFADTEFVSASHAIGRISADLIAPYPPGVAVVALALLFANPFTA